MLADFDSLRQLPVAEKLHVIQVLWDDLSTSDKEIPLPSGLRAEVEERLAEFDGDPSTAMSREELWRRVDELRG